jgi:hypothetical protein
VLVIDESAGASRRFVRSPGERFSAKSHHSPSDERRKPSASDRAVRVVRTGVVDPGVYTFLATTM